MNEKMHGTGAPGLTTVVIILLFEITQIALAYLHYLAKLHIIHACVFLAALRV